MSEYMREKSYFQHILQTFELCKKSSYQMKLSLPICPKIVESEAIVKS